MEHFKYKNNSLYCENVSVAAIAREFGTPCYIYSYHAFVTQLQNIKKAFAPVDPLVCFALKTNDNSAVIKTMVDQGAGCDIVSGGELYKALKVNADPKKIVFASVGKTDTEIRDALKAGILLFNVESLPELSRINEIAGETKTRAGAALRINPDVKAPTHDRITTGTLDKKFGLDLSTAELVLLNRQKYSWLDISGIHMHIGSQITTVEPYVAAMKKVLAFLHKLGGENIPLKYFDLGGGFGIPYDHSPVTPIGDFAKELIPLLKETRLRIIMEPGRYITGNSGILVMETLYIKDNGVKKFIIVDAGMNDLPRPSLYDAYHEIVPVKKTSAPEDVFDVVGPICESGDFFAKKRTMPSMKRGDLLAIKSAGAYCYAMSSNYNVRGRGAEVMVKGNDYHLIRERETIKDLLRGEQMPDFLKS
ncbi:MAG: diaminopimelate decarboxylase [Candidatus Omnitrophota bacterium]